MAALPRDPARYAEEIADFLRIDFPESRARFRNNMVESAHQDSIGGWRSAIDPAALGRMHDEAGELLRSLGYET